MVSSRSFLDSFISSQQNDQTAYRPRHIVICYNRADARSFDIEFNTPCLDRHNTQPKFQLIEKDLLSSKSWVVYKETQEKRGSSSIGNRSTRPPQQQFFDHFWPFFRQLPLYLSQN